MPPRLLPFLAALCLAATSAGCFQRMADELEESREEARAREADREAAQAAHEGPWPWPGSHVRYAVEGPNWTAQVDLAYSDGLWTGTCEGLRDGPGDARRVRGAGVFAPLQGPAGVEAGDAVTVEVLSECRVEKLPLVVQGLRAEDAVREGEAVRVRAWWADEGPAHGARDDAASWDEDTRLLLRWRASAGDQWVRGEVTDTDAPLG